MKLKYFIPVVLLFGILFVGCTKIPQMFDRDGKAVSDTMFVPIFDFTESNTVVRTLGTEWNEPGFKCMSGDDDLTAKVKVDASEITDINKPDLYTVKYTVTNKHGYTKVDYRYVLYIKNLDNIYNLAGTWKRGISDFYMDITPNKTVGFWNVSNMDPGVVTNDVPVVIADVGDGNYKFGKTYYQKLVTLELVYAVGTAKLKKGSNDKLTFEWEMFKYKDNSSFGETDITWTKQ